MTEKMLTIRLDEHEHRALKLFAVSQGRSVNALVTELIRAELDRHTTDSGRRPGQHSDQSREEFVAGILARFGIDPNSPEHQAAAERARASIQRPAGDNAAGDSTRQGAA